MFPDTLFLLDFGGATIPNNYISNLMFWIIGILVIIILITLIYVFILRKKHKKTVESAKKEIAKTKRKNNAKSKAKEIKTKEVSKEVIQQENPKETIVSNYDEQINKFLTENEKEVVGIIKENQGISQYDILNHLPHLTKSNLSKIISKLNSRKFLNRIRVGKVNKIHLGERLDESEKQLVEE